MIGVRRKSISLTSIAVLAAALAAVLSGCGSGGSQDFSAKGVPFSFSFPAGWTISRTPASSGEAGAALQSVTAALEEPYDQVTTSLYKLKKSIPEGERAYQPEVDRIVGRLTREAGGSASAAKEIEFGGLPGYQYTLKYAVDKVKLENRMTFLFDGNQQYLIGCQSAPEKREELAEGCDQILDSFKVG